MSKHNHVVFPLLLVSAVALSCSGCSTQKTMEAVTGTISTRVSLPYSRSIDDAIVTVKSNVEPLMQDEAARRFRDEVIADMAQQYRDKLSTGDGQEIRAQLVEKMLSEDFKDALQRERNHIFRMTHQLPSHSANGDIFGYYAAVGEGAGGDKGAFSGNMSIGRKYCHYNSIDHKRRCNDEESYRLSLDGSYVYSTNSLEVIYKLELKQYNSSIGLNSVLNRDALASALRGTVPTGFKTLQKEVDDRYESAVREAAAKIRKRLNARVQTSTHEGVTLKELPIDNNFETSMARLQRKLDRFKYDKEKSTFVFADEKSESFFGLPTFLPSKLIVKLFPEKKGTVAVFQVDYTSATDDLTGKPLFSERDVKKQYAAQVTAIERILEQ